MPEKKNSDKKHPFAEMLDDVFGPGKIDLDNYDSERAKRDKLRDEEIRQRMARLNKKESKSPVSDGEVKVASKVPHGGVKVADGEAKVASKVADRETPVHTKVSHGETPVSDPPVNQEALSLLDLPVEMKIEIVAGSSLRKKLLLHILDNHDFKTSYDELSRRYNSNKSTVKKAINHLERYGVLRKQPFRSGVKQGIHIEVIWNENLKNEIKETLANIAVSPTVSHGETPVSDVVSHPPLNKEINNLSIKDKLMSWKNEDLKDWYPLLYQSGFKAHSLHQMVELMDKRSRDLELVITSLDHIEWEMGNGGVKNGKGQPVEGVPGYFFKTMTEHSGFYRQPKGYVDPREAELLRTKEKLKKIEEEKAALEKKEFELWKSSLSNDDIEKYETLRKTEATGGFAEPLDAFLKRKWREENGRPVS